MNIRLFPILLFAVTSLLTLKAFDMIFSGEALFDTAQAQAEEKKPEEKKPEEKKAEEKPATPAEAAKPAAAANGEEKARSLLEGSNERPKEKIVLPKGEESAETALGERLGEKRRLLEDRTKELDLRENLIKAAESKLEERTKEIKELQAKLDEQTKTKQEQTGLQIKGVVQMYETMKPGAAAAIFDKLDMKVMIEVVSRMKPALTAAIMAKMTPDTAQKLTSELARRSLHPQEPAVSTVPFAVGSPQPSANTKELPRIDTQPAKRN